MEPITKIYLMATVVFFSFSLLACTLRIVTRNTEKSGVDCLFDIFGSLLFIFWGVCTLVGN